VMLALIVAVSVPIVMTLGSTPRGMFSSAVSAFGS
jgi:hypothetical protein